MRLFIYVFLLVVTVIVYKVFYFDYLPKEPDVETNSTVQEIESTPVETVKPTEPVKNKPIENPNKTGMNDRSKMPIDRLGDSIADSLKEKISNHN
jgi:hypothetical protein